MALGWGSCGQGGGGGGEGVRVQKEERREELNAEGAWWVQKRPSLDLKGLFQLHYFEFSVALMLIFSCMVDANVW